MRRRNAIPRNEREAEARERHSRLCRACGAMVHHSAQRRKPREPVRGRRTVTLVLHSGTKDQGSLTARRPRPNPSTLNRDTLGAMRELSVRDARQASDLGQYWNAVHHYLANWRRIATQEISRQIHHGCKTGPLSHCSPILTNWTAWVPQAFCLLNPSMRGLPE